MEVVKEHPNNSNFLDPNGDFEDELPGEKNLNYLTASATQEELETLFENIARKKKEIQEGVKELEEVIRKHTEIIRNINLKSKD